MYLSERCLIFIFSNLPLCIAFLPLPSYPRRSSLIFLIIIVYQLLKASEFSHELYGLFMNDRYKTARIKGHIRGEFCRGSLCYLIVGTESRPIHASSELSNTNFRCENPQQKLNSDIRHQTVNTAHTCHVA
jgi:hypothetical protein